MTDDLSGNFVLFYLGLGLIAGIFSATFGVGSGIIMVPLLTLIAHFPQKEAQGAALAVMIPLSLMGTFRYYINPDIPLDIRVILLLSVTCIVGSNIGASIAGYVSNRTLQFGFSIVLMLAAIRMFLTALRSSS
ncbi:MAG: sulfite exporter TauE/SafE family protein [Candidatus Omnitrophota bacterium]|jgi:uncharacterized membrane protein YfcA|nr:MAG: sulfite exporter TauE/SafE family protein [Candidatus Omnitrophota bacterium]